MNISDSVSSSSSPTAGRSLSGRVVFFALIALLACAASGLRAAPVHEVLVYSRVTAEGRERAMPTALHPAYSVLHGAGVHDVGPPLVETDAMDAGAVKQLLKSALRTRHFRAEEVTSGVDTIVVFHWGSLSPIIFEKGTADEAFVNGGELLSALGTRVLDRALFSERAELLAAVREERYYLIVSAYAVAGAERRPAKLLWRTHLSVLAQDLSQQQAMPLLCEAGLACFGRDTVGMSKSAIKVATPVVAKN